MSSTVNAFNHYTLPSGATLRNRLFMAPMTIYDSYENGMISDHEIEYYRLRSSGVGAVITAATYVSELGKAFESGPGITQDSHIPGLSKLARTIQSQGAKAILQIFHGGRMVEPDRIKGQQPVAPSPVKALRETTVTPRELSHEEILTIIEEFGHATKRAILAGFDGIEIHGANTYLIQQFFSPHSNRRQDQWGGSLEKRLTFPLQVIRKIKEVVSQYGGDRPFIIGYRLSPEEIEEPGISLDDTLFLIDQLIAESLDYIHISLGKIWRGSLRQESETSVLETIVHHVDSRIPIMGVGSVKNKADIEQAIAKSVDLIAIGRQLIIDPKTVDKLVHNDSEAVRYTLSYHDKELLGISDSTWQYISKVDGWFPITSKKGAESNNEPWIQMNTNQKEARASDLSLKN